MKNLPFTDEELKILRGNYRKIAKKHGITPEYVSYLLHGKRPIISTRAKAIINDLRKLLEAYKEVL